MRRTICSILAFIVIGGAIMRIAECSSLGSEKKPIRVLLLGASVGDAWNFSEWPMRMHRDDYAMEMVAEYAFDKTNALEEIFMRPRRKFRLTRTYLRGFFEPGPRKPDILIIKECAAYFPGNLETYKGLVKSWVRQCREAGIKPVLATVVPVTQEHAQGRPGRLEGILAYNDWVRAYSKENNIGLLDLEAALRIGDSDRSLRTDLTSGDGLHLNTNAYAILDNLLGAQLKN
jgi:hypothetical protein